MFRAVEWKQSASASLSLSALLAEPPWALTHKQTETLTQRNRAPVQWLLQLIKPHPVLRFHDD